jgi:hypothetical protein
MNLEKIDKEVLERYVETRNTIAKRSDRIVALSHMLNLLRHCDGEIEVDPSSLAVVGDLVDSDICSILEMLDAFIYVVEAEAVLGE